MTLIKTGSGITDIRGPVGGVYFTRDKSGLHCTAKPRRVHQRTTAQDKQRNAFIKARTVTKDPRWVSYFIYLALNDIPFPYDAIVTGDPDPDCKGTYEVAGTYNEKDYYKRKDSTYFLWYFPHWDWWIISTILGDRVVGYWRNELTFEGEYIRKEGFDGAPFVKLQLRPPPADYQIPKL